MPIARSSRCAEDGPIRGGIPLATCAPLEGKVAPSQSAGVTQEDLENVPAPRRRPSSRCEYSDAKVMGDGQQQLLIPEAFRRRLKTGEQTDALRKKRRRP